MDWIGQSETRVESTSINMGTVMNVYLQKLLETSSLVSQNEDSFEYVTAEKQFRKNILFETPASMLESDARA